MTVPGGGARGSPGAWARPLAALLLCAALALALLRARPVAARGADAPDDAFSAARAFPTVEAIARRPHPAGSPESLRVRTWLVERLTALGLEPVLQTAPRARGRPVALANVLVRIPGTASTGVVLLAAHTDTKPVAPGAGDDGAAVGSVLETLRALRAGPPLANDLVVLLSDGEELGLLGARLFADEHPWMRDVSVVLNFDARGSAGACLMFETSGAGGGLVEHYAASVARPAASSLMAAIYRRMPNDTDFTVLARERGLPGLNLAFLEGYTTYHMPTDVPERLDLDTLQHQGETMLALVRRLGHADLRDLAGDDLVYFDLLGAWLPLYPRALALPLALATLALLLLVLWRGARRAGSEGPGRRSARAWLAAVVALALPAALAFALGRAVIALVPGAVSHPARGTAGDVFFFAAASLFALAATVSALALAARRVGADALRTPGLLLWGASLLASAVALPEASFLFQWPLLFALLGGAAARGARAAPWAPLVQALGLVPALLVTAPLIQRLYAALTLTGAAAGAAACAGVLLLVLPPFLPRDERRARALYRGTLAAGLAAVAGGVLAI